MKRHERLLTLTLGLAATVVLTVGPASRADTPAFDLLRSVPLTIDGYMTGTMAYPETFTSADQVIKTLGAKRNLLFHMETLRRSYMQLPDAEKTVLLEKLTKRYQASDEDPVLFFDHGWAQLVFNHNKTGLFFLRKANDRIQDQFSAMAYAMAQAEVDINQEGGTLTGMDQRKMSAENLMEDAAKRNADTPKPGFWPSFVSVMNALKVVPAYADMTGTDFSVVEVPYGHTTSSDSTTNATTASDEGIGMPDKVQETQSCPVVETAPLPTGKPVSTQQFDLNNDGSPETLKFYKAEAQDGHDMYQVVVTDAQGRVMGNFTSSVSPYITEDLDGDKIFEMVIRQPKIDPLHPVLVYRYDGCQYKQDEDIEALFK